MVSCQVNNYRNNAAGSGSDFSSGTTANISGKENTFGNIVPPRLLKLRTMKSLLVIFILVINLSAFSQAGPDSLGKMGVSRTLSNFASAWNRHDVKAFTMIFAKDADFTNVVGAGGHGRAELEKFYAKPFQSWFKNAHFVVVREKIRLIRPDVAAVDAWWEMSGVVDAQGKPKSLRKGLLNFTMTRQGDRWLIVVMHNLDLADD